MVMQTLAHGNLTLPGGHHLLGHKTPPTVPQYLTKPHDVVKAGEHERWPLDGLTSRAMQNLHSL